MKCQCCKKKTTLEFKCGCGQSFCVSCRLPEVHKCDAKEGQKIVLDRVVADKVDKI